MRRNPLSLGLSLKDSAELGYDSSMYRSTQFRIISIDANLINSCFVGDTIYRKIYSSPYYTISSILQPIISSTTPEYSVVLPQWDEYLSTGDCQDMTVGLATKDYTSHAIQIYPNPCKGELKIYFQDNSISKFDYEVYTYTGKLIKEGTLNQHSNYEIHTNQIPSGFYLLRLKNINQAIRFVKE